MAARIYQRIKNAMQSGRAKVGTWTLEFEPGAGKRADPLMGWAGSGFTDEQIRLSFPTLDAAKAYAEARGVAYHVVTGNERSLKLQTYATNFDVGPVIPAGEV